MPAPLPCLILTGASGVVGRSFLEAAQDRFHIYALARRPQQKSGVPPHPNVRWLQVDIGSQEALRTVMAHIRERCDPDYVVHLAAHYDFETIELPDYQHTNIDGTRHVLEEARKLGVEHFIFASSVAACEFPDEGDAIVAYLQSPVRQHRFPDYATMSYSDLRWYTGVVYDLLSAAVRTGDRGLLLGYAYNIAKQRFAEGFPASEVCDALLAISDVTVEELLYKPEVASYQDEVRDSIRLSVALAVDGVQDAFDLLQSEAASGTERDWAEIDGELEDLESIVEKLNAFYKPINNGAERRMRNVG